MRLFGKSIFNRLEKGKVVKCLEKDCKGIIKKVRFEREQYTPYYYEDTIFYRCTRNCRHKWKININNSSEKIIVLKY